MHQDERRINDIQRPPQNNRRHTRLNARKNKDIHLIITGAYPPVESNQKKTQKSNSSSPGPIPDGKATHIVRTGAAITASGAHAARGGLPRTGAGGLLSVPPVHVRDYSEGCSRSTGLSSVPTVAHSIERNIGTSVQPWSKQSRCLSIRPAQ
jgi:hypothetical protein